MAGETIIINTLDNETRIRNINPMFIPVPFEQQPKRANRFAVEFPIEFEIESFLVQKIDRPKMISIDSDYEWQNIKIDFIDVIEPSTSRSIYNVINFFKKQKNKRKWYSFKKQRESFVIYISSLDPVGIEIERWEITVKDVIAVDFGESDYSSDDIQTCSLTIKPSNCVYLD